MVSKEKRITERRDEERKMTGTSLLTCKSLVDGERQNENEEERDQDVLLVAGKLLHRHHGDFSTYLTDPSDISETTEMHGGTWESVRVPG